MKWVTREKVKVDRVACPWLIRKFIDQDAEFLFVPADRVPETAEREGAIPFDVPGAELGHHEGKCSFEAIVAKYGIKDPAVLLLAQIVHGADVKADLYGRPEAPGLEAVAEGFRHLGLKDDHEILEKQFIVYDALYAYCRSQVRSLTADDLRGLLGGKGALILDIRRSDDFAAEPAMIPGALRREPDRVEVWSQELPKDRDIVIYCARGGSVSNRVLDDLLERGIQARYLEGGIEAWKKTEK